MSESFVSAISSDGFTGRRL